MFCRGLAPNDLQVIYVVQDHFPGTVAIFPLPVKQPWRICVNKSDIYNSTKTKYK